MDPPLILMAALAAALPVKPAPAEVIASVPVTPTRFRLLVAELVDSNVPKLTVEPKAPLVETLIAPPVPVLLTVATVSEPTAVPLRPKKAGVLPMLKPRRALPLPKSTPLPAVVVIVSAVPVLAAKVVYADVLLASAVKTVLKATAGPVSVWLSPQIISFAPPPLPHRKNIRAQ